MEILPLDVEDYNPVRTLELFCIREYIEQSLDRRWDDLSPELINKLGASGNESFEHFRETGLSFVAKEENKVVGFIFAQILNHVYNTNVMVWVENEGVHPNNRRSGIGSALLEKVIEEGKLKGAQAIHSAIMPEDTTSIMLHRRMGFFIDARKVALLDLESD